MNYTAIHDSIIDRARPRQYDKSIHHLHHIIPVHENLESEEVVPLTLKEHWVVHRLRFKMIGTIGNYLAWCMLKGHSREICSAAGKIGGKITRQNKLGIFSDSYDRSATSRHNWQSGRMDHIDFTTLGARAGATTRANGSGIFRPDLQYLRSDWARHAAAQLWESGIRNGFVSDEYRRNNTEKIKQDAAKGGKIGGSIVGKMMWWNDGTSNRRCMDCPGEGWVRGMLMSEKKRTQFETMKRNQMNRKTNNE